MNVALMQIERHAQTLLMAGQLLEAEKLLRPMLSSGTGPIVLWRQLARAVLAQGRIDEARAIQEMIVRTLPGDLSARFDLSETLLLQGEFARGWREYRFRYDLSHTKNLERKVQRPRWEGQPLPGKTLLIHDEQGYGDTFQFLRMVAWARERSQARVILQINADSLSLAKRCGGFDSVIVRGSLPPPFDYHCEMMSLPLAMNLQLSDLPGATSYLQADPVYVSKWKARLDELIPHSDLRVGLVWAGRPTHSNDAKRSVTLAELAPLAQSGVTFVSLQKGPSTAQGLAPPEGMKLLTVREESDGFEDAAAILNLVDVLVSIDSSLIHLAGALGRPAWVMLPFLPDWRWLLNRNDSPWYPSVRLFRQPKPDDWASVTHAIATELAQLKVRGV
jgi:hypothetical protein